MAEPSTAGLMMPFKVSDIKRFNKNPYYAEDFCLSVCRSRGVRIRKTPDSVHAILIRLMIWDYDETDFEKWNRYTSEWMERTFEEGTYRRIVNDRNEGEIIYVVIPVIKGRLRASYYGNKFGGRDGWRSYISEKMHIKKKYVKGNINRKGELLFLRKKTDLEQICFEDCEYKDAFTIVQTDDDQNDEGYYE